jgi:hypothetical protein
MFKETTTNKFSNAHSDSIIISFPMLDVRRMLCHTPMDKVFSSCFASFKYITGSPQEVGSICEVSMKDTTAFTYKITKLADDQSLCEMEILSSDTKCPGYTLRCLTEEITYDNSCLVTYQTIFREGTSSDYMTKIKKLYSTCLTDLKNFFGSGHVRSIESCVVTGIPVETLFSQYKVGTGIYSYVKSWKYSRGDAETLGSIREIETLEGEKFSLKMIELSSSDYSLRMELMGGSTFKSVSAPTSMVTGIKMTQLLENKVLVEVANWFSSDVKPEFFDRRTEMSKVLIHDLVKLSKTESSK